MARVLRVDVCLLLMCLAYFPTIYATSYQEYTVTHPKVCSPTGKKGKIKLTRSNEAAVFKETRSFDKWSGHVKYHCQFEVKDTGDNDRVVFAVIQNLKFRRSEKSCIDYVEFRSDGAPKRICGEVAPSVTSPYASGEVAPYAFIGSDEIDVTIFVANKELEPDETLELDIVFTSAKKCFNPQTAVQVSSSSYIHCDDLYCIASQFANDSIINCPFTDCRDEGGCIALAEDPPYRRTNISTKVTIGAATTVLICFVLFFGCIWLLRHYNKLCWSQDYSGSREVRLTPVPPVPVSPDILEEGHTPTHTRSHGGVSPTAPPLNNPEATILPDKDMPPSYDSLFPSASR